MRLKKKRNFFFFSSRRRHTRSKRDWSSDVCSSDLKKTMRYVFPDHWSFLLGEVALYSFVILVMTGIYLTFFLDRKSTRLNSSHVSISYAVFCLKKKKITIYLISIKPMTCFSNYTIS